MSLTTEFWKKNKIYWYFNFFYSNPSFYNRQFKRLIFPSLPWCRNAVVEFWIKQLLSAMLSHCGCYKCLLTELWVDVISVLHLLFFSFLYLGTTALFALLKGDILTVANVGDSRGIICDKNSKAIPLSYDHKPYNVCINCKLLFLDIGRHEFYFSSFVWVIFQIFKFFYLILLAHLSWKLKWVFLTTFCLVSICLSIYYQSGSDVVFW